MTVVVEGQSVAKLGQGTNKGRPRPQEGAGPGKVETKMGKYRGTAGCGHKYEISLYGLMVARDERLGRGMCNGCYAEMKRRIEASNEVEIAALVNRGMQQLDGMGDGERSEALGKMRVSVAAGQGTMERREAARRILRKLGDNISLIAEKRLLDKYEGKTNGR